MSKQKPPAIFLMGPTASGKTAAAMALVDALVDAQTDRSPLELVNVDSAQIYRGMDIGTAKPGAATLARYPHHLIDFLDPAERYSAAQFRDDALRVMAEITARGNVPLLVGGTGMYFRVLENGMAAMPDADPTLRAELDTEAEARGWPALHAELAAVDPEGAARISPNDSQRIQRALEVWRRTGKPLSEHWAEQWAGQSSEREGSATGKFPYRLLKLAVWPQQRAELHRRIEQRFHDMMAAGFLAEVRKLHTRGDLGRDLPSVRAVGYRQIWEYLEGEQSLDEAVRKGIVASRRYAKRQITWLRSEPDLRVFEATEPGLHESLAAAVDKFLAGPI